MRVVRCGECGATEDELRDCGAYLTECCKCGKLVCIDCAHESDDKRQVLCRACWDVKMPDTKELRGKAGPGKARRG